MNDSDSLDMQEMLEIINRVHNIKGTDQVHLTLNDFEDKLHIGIQKAVLNKLAEDEIITHLTFTETNSGKLSQNFIGLMIRETTTSATFHVNKTKFSDQIESYLYKNKQVMMEIKYDAGDIVVYADKKHIGRIRFADGERRQLLIKCLLINPNKLVTLDGFQSYAGISGITKMNNIINNHAMYRSLIKPFVEVSKAREMQFKTPIYVNYDQYMLYEKTLKREK